MVTFGILNSISKEIIEAVLYASSSSQLWAEIPKRHDKANGPLIYQLKSEIYSMSHGSMTILEYYTKIKILWDELLCLVLMLKADHECEMLKEIVNKIFLGQLMEFLMGLHDGFDPITNQIVLMEPLPCVNKAFSMVTRVEK